MSSTRVTVAGEPEPSGAYLLRIRLRSACDVIFGRFNGGRAIHLPAGDYVYVGSAMGRIGSATLANRLLRHARRYDGAPHLIYSDLADQFVALGWLQHPQVRARSKTLRWHIDYLLDRSEAELAQVFIFCSTERRETVLARQLMADPATTIVVSGLGSSDDTGNTHLLRVSADENWWEQIVAGNQRAG